MSFLRTCRTLLKLWKRKTEPVKRSQLMIKFDTEIVIFISKSLDPFTLFLFTKTATIIICVLFIAIHHALHVYYYFGPVNPIELRGLQNLKEKV